MRSGQTPSPMSTTTIPLPTHLPILTRNPPPKSRLLIHTYLPPIRPRALRTFRHSTGPRRSRPKSSMHRTLPFSAKLGIGLRWSPRRTHTAPPNSPSLNLQTLLVHRWISGLKPLLNENPRNRRSARQLNAPPQRLRLIVLLPTLHLQLSSWRIHFQSQRLTSQLPLRRDSRLRLVSDVLLANLLVKHTNNGWRAIHRMFPPLVNSGAMMIACWTRI